LRVVAPDGPEDLIWSNESGIRAFAWAWGRHPLPWAAKLLGLVL